MSLLSPHKRLDDQVQGRSKTKIYRRLHFLVHTWKIQAVPSDSRRRKSFLWVFLIRDSPEILAPNVIPQGLGLNMQMGGGGKEAFRTQQCVMAMLLGTHHAEKVKPHVSLSSVINLR